MSFWQYWRQNKKYSVFIAGLITIFLIIVYIASLVVFLQLFVIYFGGVIPGDFVFVIFISIVLACIPTVLIYQYLDYKGVLSV